MIIKARRKFDIASLKFKFQETKEYKDLNEGQKRFVEEFFKGKNIFLSGEAGTGKSYVLRALRTFLEANGLFVGVAASTGVAAINVGGMTLHSFSGIGLGDEDVVNLIQKASANKRARRRIQEVKVLIIDEISMLGSLVLDKVNEVFKSIRGNRKAAFGGVQLILTGDHMQLPPVFRDVDDDFSFNSDFWEEAEVKTIELEEQVRQANDPIFGKLLSEIRMGSLTDPTPLIARIGAKLTGDIKPIQIFCKNIDVDRQNQKELDKIKAPSREFWAQDSGEERYIQYFDRNCQAPRKLVLKTGAQVMLLVNLDLKAGLCNGSLGRVEGFTHSEVLVKFASGTIYPIGVNEWEIKEQEAMADGTFRYKVKACRSQIPLKLAYAVTIHKVQGQTFDKAIIDPGEIFCDGMMYVALSRLKSLEGLSLKSFDINKITANKECARFYKNLP